MSMLHVNQIKSKILELYKDIIDLGDITTAPEEQKKNYLLTRSLAAYSLQHCAQIESTLAARTITDGSEDNGIDAIYYDERNKVLYLVQSKWIHNGRGEPESGDVKKFVDGVKDLFDLSFDRFNEKVRRVEEIITRAVCDSKTTYQLILCYTGSNELSDHSRRTLYDFLDEINDTSELVYLNILHQRALHSSLAAGLSGEPIDLTISIKSWGRVQEPRLAYYGQVNGLEVAKWWDDYRSRLFNKNIRGILGDTDVNEEIRKTIENEPDKFWYYNNGVTMVCKNAEKTMLGGADRDVGQFVCEDISIVNGAQTVGTIGKYGEKTKINLDQVYIPIRIISTGESEDDFGEQITKSNNKQNKIDSRDFVSLDPEQSRIKTELAIDGVTYHILRSEVLEKSESSFDLNESTTALACASDNVNTVVQLKSKISKLWDDLEKGYYKQIFNRAVTGHYTWRCVQVQRFVDDSLSRILIGVPKSGRDYGVAVHGNRIISMLVFKELDSNKLKDVSFNFNGVITKELIFDYTHKYYYEIKDVISEKYSQDTMAVLFKNRTKCTDIVNTVIS
ncbi:AIPR family protein [Cohnella phaseoli]|uniref:AIPR protein n=1 Tax=Cohnella phaseoli TaxID=456490 RepID=A0A3D9HQV8_9BACL|nr:AIPR family protein [Cohnella phaseoli]RED51775.1 AIPR protein [Cohnella phaseoli]